ncbi:Aspartate beta-hydroxylase domain-containing protein 2 [Hondaea fermentalgiana]|uniref:Aspartate beta-hydroxylase domain-containing protein 2 n=1 Tax=Hondaea fermentalgiana TaxID=2315210 RepID=A0A2R5GCZ4_9STRA|nr:Aspartate beta-hydroxylase domain-containing protein 2 [Hondaea fermentalgiana]|eukprot:GBG28852.1 Aspartate beta-hydroxylase domain-containing protein 2 [Hondaea fermentalgiana]
MAATIVRSGALRLRGRPGPSLFSLAGLGSQPIWGGAARPAWAASLEREWTTVRDEYEAVKARRGSDYAVADGEHKLHAGDWEWRSFVLKGEWQGDMAAQCPRTAEILREHVPDLMTGLPFAYCFFSTLKAGSAIQPHYAPCNLRVRCHLGLSVPSENVDDCGIRVADQAQAWQEGSALVFDDAFEHETWNKTEEDRVVLLLDVWHPDISLSERQEIIDMFASVRRN